MKLNHKFVRTVTTTAAVLGAAAMLSVGAFAAEADINDPAAAGYLPPQEQMVQGAYRPAQRRCGDRRKGTPPTAATAHRRETPDSGQHHADLRR